MKHTGQKRMPEGNSANGGVTVWPRTSPWRTALHTRGVGRCTLVLCATLPRIPTARVMGQANTLLLTWQFGCVPAWRSMSIFLHSMSSIFILPFLFPRSNVSDFKNVSIVAHYVKERTKNAQFIIIRWGIESI